MDIIKNLKEKPMKSSRKIYSLHLACDSGVVGPLGIGAVLVVGLPLKRLSAASVLFAMNCTVFPSDFITSALKSDTASLHASNKNMSLRNLRTSFVKKNVTIPNHSCKPRERKHVGFRCVAAYKMNEIDESITLMTKKP